VSAHGQKQKNSFCPPENQWPRENHPHIAGLAIRLQLDVSASAWPPKAVPTNSYFFTMKKALTVFLATCALGLSAQTSERTDVIRPFQGAEVQRAQYIQLDSNAHALTPMPTTGTDTLTTCTGTLSDPGGPSNYPNNAFSSVLIDVPGALSVTLDFTSFDLEFIFDYLKIYDGGDINAPLIGYFTGSNLPAGGNIPTNTGRVFLEFSSNAQNNRPGFDMTWQCTPSTTPPAAAFQAVSNFVCDGFVQFTNVSTLAVSSWFWDFGDGTTSTQAQPSHQYAANGSYDVTLIVCNNIGCDTLRRNNFITVFSTSVCTSTMPSRSVSSSTACQGILLDPGGFSDYDDNENSTYVIQPAGATSIVMDFTAFETDDSFDNLRIYNGPNTNSPLIGTYSGATLPNGGTVTASSGAATLVFISDAAFTAPGFEMEWHAVNAQNGAVASFSAPQTAPVAATVNFTDQSIGAATYVWDFGDGTTSTLSNPSHSYATAGAYTVTLRVESADGCIGVYSQVIFIGTVAAADPLANNFRIWPNPSNGLLEVEASGLSPEPTRITVHNAFGQQVHAEVCPPGTTLRRSLDLRHVANGMYFVRMETSFANSVHKVVIDHAAQ
jgi:PKD repeat protein